MSINIKSRMGSYDFHIVVDRSERTAKCFDRGGQLRWAIPALAWGQSENWHEPGGDTPPGLYRMGLLYELDPPEPAFGFYCIDLEDMENQETGNGRAGISMHGGGSACPDPFADFQPLMPTHGCTRSYNAHMKHKVVPTYKYAKSKGGVVYVSVVE